MKKLGPSRCIEARVYAIKEIIRRNINSAEYGKFFQKLRHQRTILNDSSFQEELIELSLPRTNNCTLKL